MEVEITPTRKVIVLGLDKRSVGNIGWCATAYGMSRLCWIDGHLMCVEVYEKSFDHELKQREFPISQICYAPFPKYEKVYEVEKSLQIPIVDVSDMKLFQNVIKAILAEENKSA